MDRRTKTLRISIAAGVCILLLWLFGGGLVNALVETFSNPDTVSMLMYLETGRVVRFLPVEETEPAPTQPPEQTEPSQPPEETEPSQPPEQTEPAQESIAVFGQSDADLVQVHSYCGYDSDVPAWLAQPLSWDLTQQEPTVLIVHSHATESYANTQDYKESSAYRTLDNNYNVVSIGTALTQALEARGIGVIHDTTLHDHPSYSDSYAYCRETVQAYLDKYPSIAMVLDIHRDAVTDDDGSQMAFSCLHNDQTAAQLMLVVGTDAGGLTHPDWQSNMSLAVKLHAQLEKNCSGICRPISFRSQRFNQDLSPGALIVEVGGTGNTQQEALRSVDVLAQAIYDLSAGTQ